MWVLNESAEIYCVVESYNTQHPVPTPASTCIGTGNIIPSYIQ